MRTPVAITLCAVVATAGAGDRVGRVVRVERAPSQEVVVPAGTFAMGVTDKEAEDAVDACQRAYEAAEIVVSFITPGGAQTTVCNRYAEELAQMQPRDVTLSAFAIDRDEVSVVAYRACVAAGACDLDPLVDGDERYLQDDGPMVNVTWFEARDFCRWRGSRLPSEAEWERAARGDDGRVWPWGAVARPNDFNHGQPRADAMRTLERVVSLDLLGDPDPSDGAAGLASPGSYPWGAGPYGTRDQAGNVAEWTADARGTSDNMLGYAGIESRINPLREGKGTDPRVVRGGSWRQPQFLGHTNLRDPFGLDPGTGATQLYLPQQRFSHVGFRCARSL